MDMSDAAVNGLFLLAGVLLGFALNEGAWWLRHRLLETTERKSIRAALELEYEHNRAAMMGLWQRVTSDPMPVGTHEEQSLDKRYRLASATLPSWSHLMWQSNAAKLTRVLRDDEFNLLLDLHASLDTFTLQVGDIRQRFEDESVKILLKSGSPQLAIMVASEDPNERARVEDFRTVLTDTFPAWSKCDEIHTKFYGREVAIKLDK
jgi:hypothetical protein